MQKASIKEVLNGSDDTKFVTPKTLSKYFSTKQNGGGGGGSTADLSNYYNKQQTAALIDAKIDEIPEPDLSNYYNKQETDAKIDAIPEPDLSNYYNKTETEAVVTSMINAIPEPDLSDYYNKSETEDLVDNKVSELPLDGLLHYKGHVNTVTDLPSTGQPTGTPTANHAVISSSSYTGVLSRNTTDRDLLKTKMVQYGHDTYRSYIGNYEQYSSGARGVRWQYICTNYPDVFDYIASDFGSNFLGRCWFIHVNASVEKPVYSRYYTGSVTRVVYDDTGTWESVAYTAPITRPCWIVLDTGTGSWNQLYGNLTKPLKFKKFPYSSYIRDDGDTEKMSVILDSFTVNEIENGYIYNEGYSLFRFDAEELVNFCGSEAQCKENDVYTVGSNYEIYRCNNKPAWEHWSAGSGGYVDLSNYYNKSEVDELIENIPSSGGGDGVDTLPIGSIVEYDGDTVPDGYEEVDEEFVLYNNEEGSIDAITLNDDVSNYKYIEIFCDAGYTKLYHPNGKGITLSTIVNADTIYYSGVRYTISGRTITPSFNKAWYLSTTNTNTIKLYRVVGYK